MNTPVENLRLVSGRLYWRPTGDAGYLDFANVVAHKHDPERKRLEHFRSKRGSKRVDYSFLTSLKERWSFTCDEHAAAALRTLALGTPAAEVLQAAGAGVAASIASAALAVGRVYDTGSRDLSALVGVTVAGPVALVKDVDYSVDLGAGLITVLANTHFGSNWNFTFNRSQQTTLQVEAFSKLLELGQFLFVEEDALDEIPVTMQPFAGQVYVTNWGDNTLEKVNEFIIEVLFTP